MVLRSNPGRDINWPTVFRDYFQTLHENPH